DAPPPRSEGIPRKYMVVAGGMFGLLLMICVFLLLRLRGLETSANPPLPRFWQSFLAGSRPVEVVVPSPLYFFWPERGVNVRDLTVSEFSNWQSSQALRDMAAKWGPPKMSQNYVGAPEMNAGIRLLQYLQPRA